MPSLGFAFSKIYVLESLPSHEREAGKYFNEEVFPYCRLKSKSNFKTELFKIENKNDFFEVLIRISLNTGSDLEYPLIHFEIHGREDQQGLTIKNGDLIHWDELIPILQEINAKCFCNLFVILAVCSGAHILKKVVPKGKVFPFYGFTGPNNPEMGIILELKYSEFYLSLIANANGDEAVRKLNEENRNSSISFISCDFLLYEVYVKEINNPAEVEKIKKAIIIPRMNQLNLINGDSQVDEKKMNVFAEKAMNDFKDKVFKTLKAKYLMADHKENDGRFDFTLDELEKRLL